MTSYGQPASASWDDPEAPCCAEDEVWGFGLCELARDHDGRHLATRLLIDAKGEAGEERFQWLDANSVAERT